MEKRIITISREFGSGGRTIGKLVAEHLGIRCYDAELIQKLAVESGFDENYVKEAGEYTPGGFLASAFTDRSFGPTNEDLLWKLQYRIIRELAEKEPEQTDEEGKVWHIKIREKCQVGKWRRH